MRAIWVIVLWSGGKRQQSFYSLVLAVLLENGQIVSMMRIFTIAAGRFVRAIVLLSHVKNRQVVLVRSRKVVQDSSMG